MKFRIPNRTNLQSTLLAGLIIIAFFSSCTIRDGSDTETNEPIVTPIGNKNYFEIATWNIEWFPKNNAKTVNLVKDIIRDIDIDLIAVQEIASIKSFNTLVDSLPGWKGVLSNDQYSNGTYQKTGILYKSDFISISSVYNIFENDSYPFPRPPLSAYVEIKDINGVQYNFSVIILHLKAFSGDSNEQRRKEAILKLEDFISNEIDNGADADFIVLGDWNDRVSDAENDNVFLPFLDKPDQYSLITENFTTLIDHILITSGSLDEYGSGETEVLDLQKQLYNYSSDVSDHLPVMARFKGFTISISN